MLFKSKKSQGSLHNISAGRSPLHSPIESPLQSPAFPPPQSAAYGPGQYADPSDSQRYHSSDEPQPHLARSASRAKSQNTLSESYQCRPTVNVISDQSDENRPATLTAESATNQEERPQKRHNKRSLFGLTSSKDHTSCSSPQALSLESISSTRKKVAGPESLEGLLSRSRTTQYSGEGYSSDTYEETEASNAHPPSQTGVEPGEQYHRQQNHFDSPQSQTSSHYSSQYPDEELQHNQQQPYHVPYPRRPSDTSSAYLPYNPQPDRSSLDIYDPYRSIRPSSQHSLGPPSPVNSIQQADESGTSTPQTRQPNQATQSSYLQPQAGMPRGENSNPTMRQQLAQQHQQGGEQSHAQYGAHQGSRQLQQDFSSMTEHGRSTPPPTKSREEINNLDYDALLAKFEELRMTMRLIFFHRFTANMLLYPQRPNTPK